ncbi:MAG: AAA family ATPase [Patescibacteria group bacterium]|mgnify:CR=1 FL=1
MKLINKIEIENFKSFLKEEFFVDDLTAIVGANESGKTNVLKAINHFSKDKRYTSFGREEGDFRLDSPSFPNGEISIVCEFVLNNALIPELIKLEPKLAGKIFRLEKNGKLNITPTLSGRFTEKVTGVAGILKINNRQLFKTQMQSILDKGQLDFAMTNGWLFKNQSINLTKNPCATLLRESKIENLTEDKKDMYLAEQVQNELLQNIKILFWKYEEKEHYLPEKVPIADFVANPSQYPGVNCMFTITGWKESEYQNNLISFDSTTKDQLVRKTQDTVNDLIRKHWSTHKELTVKLSFNGDFLDISLSEPGHETPPNFRSDGFKWFLAFLLFFKKHASSLSGYVLLIDEPGGFLHPQGQKDVLKELTFLSSENQIVYTTHQTFLINKNFPDSVRIIKRERRGKGENAYDSRVYGINDRKHILTDKLLRESLGFLVSDISPVNERNILVEGEFDRELLIEANKYFKVIDLNDVSIIGCSRASNIQKYASLYTSNDLVVAGLYDSDSPGKSSFTSASGFEKLQLGEVFTNGTETIEDVLPDDVFLAGVDSWKKKIKSKKTFNATVPRIAQINRELPEDPTKKVEQKHLLEDSLMEVVKETIKKDSKKFKDFERLLNQLHKKLYGLT